MQLLGYLPRDGVPPLGEGEGAFCYVRAACHNMLTQTDGPTWLKKAKCVKGGGGLRTDTMDAMGYLNPTAAQVRTILDMARKQRWTVKAGQWWAARKEAADGADVIRFDSKVKAGMLPWRTGTSIEGICCEKGNRHKKAVATGRTKGGWQPRGEQKKIDRAIFMHSAPDGAVHRTDWEGRDATAPSNSFDL